MDSKLIGDKNNIICYNDSNRNINIEVLLQNENVWLNVNAIANLFDVQRPAIKKHIINIYEEKELTKESTYSILEHIGNDDRLQCT